MTAFPRLLCALILGLALPLGAPAQFGFVTEQATYPAEFALSFRPGAVAFPGETVTVDVTVTMDPEYNIYSLVPPEGDGPIHTQITLKGAEGFLEPIEGKEWTEPKPKRKMDPGFGIEIGYHNPKVTFSREYRVAEGANGEREISAEVFHMLCDADSCLSPRRISPTGKLLVRGDGDGGAEVAAVATPAVEPTPTATPAPTPAPAPVVTPPPDAPAAETTQSFDDAETLRQSSLMGILGFAFGLGLVSLLTPCVFPMIPITISFFTKRTHDSARERIKLAVIYAGSIVAGFALLGLGLALVMRLLGFDESNAGFIGRIAANGWINLGLAALFVAFALSLFGMFEIALPSGWANKLQQKQGGRTDVMGAVLMAVVFVLVSFTCTGPIVGPLIVLAMGGTWLTPLVALTSYAVGFALPFFVLGLAPGLIGSLPKSGGWLNATKVTMGLIELAAALKFLSNTDLVWGWGIFTREVVLASWTAIAMATALYLMGVFRMSHDGKVDSIGPLRLCFSLLFATMSFYFAYGLVGGRLQADLDAFLPPPVNPPALAAMGGGGNGGNGGRLEFIKNDLDRAMEIARAENKPVFVDFTGHTCSNCRLMENTVFPQPEVRERLEQMVRVALYTDEPGEVGERWQEHQIERYNTFSLPYYVIVSPQDQDLAAWGKGLTRKPEEFVEFLDYGLEKAREARVASAAP